MDRMKIVKPDKNTTDITNLVGWILIVAVAGLIGLVIFLIPALRRLFFWEVSAILLIVALTPLVAFIGKRLRPNRIASLIYATIVGTIVVLVCTQYFVNGIVSWWVQTGVSAWFQRLSLIALVWLLLPACFSFVTTKRPKREVDRGN